MAPPVNRFASTSSSQFQREFGGTTTTGPGSTPSIVASATLPTTCTAHVLYRVVSFTPNGELSGLWYKSAVINVSSGIADLREETNIDVFDTDNAPGFGARISVDGTDSTFDILVVGDGDPPVQWLASVSVLILEPPR